MEKICFSGKFFLQVGVVLGNLRRHRLSVVYQLFHYLGVFEREDLEREQAGVLAAVYPNARNGHARRHLHHGKQAVQPV